MKIRIYSLDDYTFLVRNGCCPEGYVEGLGMVSSQTVTVKSPSPSYPNERALGIDRRTQFLSSMRTPVVLPLIPPQAKKTTHEELTALMQKMLDENTLMPAFSPDLRVMVFKLKEEIERKRSENYEKIRKAKSKLEKDPDSKKAKEKIREAEEENAKLSEVEREIRILAVSSQKYDLKTNYSHKGVGENVDLRGSFDYNPVTGRAEIRISADKPSIDAFAHELKHAYQFETGTLSGYSHKREDGGYEYFLYDREDEREAFARGRLFGSGETFERHASVYDHIPDSRDFSEGLRKLKYGGMHTWGKWSANVISPEVLHGYELILQDPRATDAQKAKAEADLLKLSEDHNCAFRINGKTYYNTPRKKIK
jgi:hypothetical protein